MEVHLKLLMFLVETEDQEVDQVEVEVEESEQVIHRQ